MEDSKKYEFNLNKDSYFAGRVDSRNRYLPLEVKIKGRDLKFEMFFSFNESPTIHTHELLFHENEFTIEPFHQKRLTKDYSIKFKGVKPRSIKRPLPRFDTINYNYYLGLTLRHPTTRDIFKKPSKNELHKSYVFLNKERTYLFNQNYKGIMITKLNDEYLSKRGQVMQRKKQVMQDFRNKTMNNLNRHIKIREEVKNIRQFLERKNDRVCGQYFDGQRHQETVHPSHLLHEYLLQNQGRLLRKKERKILSNFVERKSKFHRQNVEAEDDQPKERAQCRRFRKSHFVIFFTKNRV